MKRLVAETYVNVNTAQPRLKKHTIVVPIDINIVVTPDNIAASTIYRDDDLQSFINTMVGTFIANGYELHSEEGSNRPGSQSAYYVFLKLTDDNIKLKLIVSLRISDHVLPDRGKKLTAKEKKKHSKKGKAGIKPKDKSGKGLHNQYVEGLVRDLVEQYPESTLKFEDRLTTIHPVDGVTYDQAIEKIEKIIDKYAKL